jgi:hypothetical protein
MTKLWREKKLAEGRLALYSGLSAANGLNSVPIADIAADLGILLKMGQEVAQIYGLSQRHLRFMKASFNFRGSSPLPAKLSQFAAKYLRKEGIVLLLKQISN